MGKTSPPIPKKDLGRFAKAVSKLKGFGGRALGGLAIFGGTMATTVGLIFTSYNQSYAQFPLDFYLPLPRQLPPWALDPTPPNNDEYDDSQDNCPSNGGDLTIIR